MNQGERNAEKWSLGMWGLAVVVYWAQHPDELRAHMRAVEQRLERARAKGLTEPVPTGETTAEGT